MYVTPYVLLLTYIIVVANSDVLQRTSVDLFERKGFYHPGPVYKKISPSKPLRCMKRCMMDLACVSFNFNRTSNECTMLGEIWQDGELIADQDTDFYGKLYF